MQKISVTFLSSYLYCPRKLYFEQVLKIIKIPREALVKGTIRHETYDGINKSEEELVNFLKVGMTYEEVFSEYKKVYTKILRKTIIKNKGILREAKLDISLTLTKTLPMILEEAKYHATNVYSYHKKTGLTGKELWESLTPKIESEVRVESDTLGLKGIIDELRR